MPLNARCSYACADVQSKVVVWMTHLLAILTGSLDTGVEVALAQIVALSLAEPVVHQAVTQPDALFGFREHHICGWKWCIAWFVVFLAQIEGWVERESCDGSCPTTSFTECLAKFFF